MEEEIVIASSSINGGIGCWDLHTGTEHLRYKSCASPPHGLTSVGHRFLASSQLQDPKASSGSILYWSWSKPQVEVKCFPEEPIKPLVANSEGTYLVGGGLSGNIYFLEVATGRLLKKWRAHYRTVTCLVFTEDDSLLVSGSEDGSVRVWSLLIDGKIHIAALNADSSSTKSHWLHIIGSLSSHSKTVTCLAYNTNGNILLAGSEDSMIRVWDPKTQNMVRVFKHAKGPVNNIHVVKRLAYLNPQMLSNAQASSRRHGSSLPPPLNKYMNTMYEKIVSAVVNLQASCNNPLDSSYICSQVINCQIKELQQQGSVAAAEMEVEKLKLDCTQSMQMLQRWKKMYDNLHEFCVDELLDGDGVGNANQI